MTVAVRVVALGLAVRLLLAWSGIGRWLAWRPEVSTAANSNLELREGLALYGIGVSPYSGTSCRLPPLALWLYGSFAADHDVLCVLPNALLDILAALLLHRLAAGLAAGRFTGGGGAAGAASSSGQGASSESADSQSADPGSRGARGTPAPPVTSPAALPALLAGAYLLNPLGLMASAAGTTAPLEGLATVAALYVSVARRPALAAAGLAVAGYLSLHSLVLLLPCACLLAHGPAECRTVAERAAPGAGKGEGEEGPSRGAGGRVLPAPHQQPASQRQRRQEEAGRRAEEEEEEEEEGDGKEEEGREALRVGQGTDGAAGKAELEQQQEAGGDGEPRAGREGGKREGVAAASEADAGAARGRSAEGSGAQARAVELLPWRMLGRCGGLLLCWLLLLALLSDVYLLTLAGAPPPQSRAAPGGGGAAASPPTCLLSALDRLLLSPPAPPLSAPLRPPPVVPTPGQEGRGGGTARLAVAVARGVAAEAARRLEATRGSLGACWAVRVYGSQILLDDAAPNVGQWWYLAMEVFEDAKVYMRLLAHSLLLALAPPLALRLGPRRPLTLFLLQLLALALLQPYPSVGDLGLATSLLPLLLVPLAPPAPVKPPPPPPPLLFLSASAALLAVLGPSMLRMWLGYESANSNFAYSAGLLGGAWQVVLLGWLLGRALRDDRAARGKA